MSSFWWIVHKDLVSEFRSRRAWPAMLLLGAVVALIFSIQMDLLPDQVIRLALLGQEEQLLKAVTPWVCSACETCTTRCPNGIDIAGVMDWLKEEALKGGIAVPEPLIADFYRLFLDSVRQGGGRQGEFRLVRRFGQLTLKRQGNFEEMKADLKLGWQRFKRGRLRLLGPPKIKGKKEIKKIFQQSGLK